MQSVEVTARLDASRTSAVQVLIADCEAIDGFRPVSDQFWIDLAGDDHDVVRVLLIDRHHPDDRGIVQGCAQAGLTAGSWTVETVLHPALRPQLAQLATMMLRAMSDALRHRNSAEWSWLVFAPTPAHDAVAAAFALSPTRRLYQMTRPLPTGLTFDITTRAFVPGQDDEAWLRVNQRAFAWNPEQGGWTLDSLRARIAEPWFDPNGFLLHERDDRLAGFCWTKVHADNTPPLGEIYVIAVDPDFHGLGLGRQLTLAGLEHLARLGITHGMLFVDADNTAAVGLYDKLGFSVHRTDCVYHGRIGRSDTDANAPTSRRPA
ncbi:unannotated protein [freshwater metagenome]|uniref:Unannotated protein n=1 Tax=freshwater metagenome TaxID=449393 RepID=A0A6J7E7V1_9ZZZZ